MKVREPRKIINYNYNKWDYQWNKWRCSLPKEGDKIKITWLPNKHDVANAYIGFEGIVENVDIVEGELTLKNSSDAILVLFGDFDYEKIQ